MPKLHNNQFRHIKNTLKQHSIWFKKLRTSFNTWQKIETGGHLREFEEGENLKSLENPEKTKVFDIPAMVIGISKLYH